MARFSKTAQGMKLEAGDVVRCFGVIGKVSQDVMILKSETAGVGVLVLVDFTRGTGEPNILNLCDIEAVRHENQWVDLKGELVAA